jgi:predicted O-linked N-acetylglucosamine transferase (SPINDLY family)
MKTSDASRLVLLVPEGSSRERVTGFLAAQGISSSRLDLKSELPLREYLKLYDSIDIFLDTIPYNGHTTSLDALWMGVPVVTMVGKTVVGRAGSSILGNLGLTEFVAASEDDYVSIARKLALDVAKLDGLRRNMRERMRRSPLMDAGEWTRSVEAAFRKMWRSWRQTK